MKLFQKMRAEPHLAAESANYSESGGQIQYSSSVENRKNFCKMCVYYYGVFLVCIFFEKFEFRMR